MSEKDHTDTSTSEAHIEDDEIVKDSDDELFDELEREIDNDFDLGALREQRIEELKQEYARVHRLLEAWSLYLLNFIE